MRVRILRDELEEAITTFNWPTYMLELLREDNLILIAKYSFEAYSGESDWIITTRAHRWHVPERAIRPYYITVKERRWGHVLEG